MKRVWDWITGRTAIRRMFDRHDCKVSLLHRLEADPVAAANDPEFVKEFRKAWHKEIHNQ